MTPTTAHICTSTNPRMTDGYGYGKNGKMLTLLVTDGWVLCSAATMEFWLMKYKNQMPALPVGVSPNCQSS
jgi:hypothetical protein